jgi:hypothetical protein
MKYSGDIPNTIDGSEPTCVTYSTAYLSNVAIGDLIRQAKVLNDALEHLAPDNDRYFVLSAERRAVLEELSDIGG